MITRQALAFVICAATVWSAERTWETGIWREAKVERPKIVFGVAPSNPDAGAPRTPPVPMEKRTYVIETDTVRFEIRLDATVDTPRLDAPIGEPVTFALEKNDIYIKDLAGREHKMKVAKRTPRAKN